jgi:ribosomal protein L24
MKTEIKFKVCDRVKKIEGEYEGETGVVERVADYDGFTLVQFDNGITWYCAKGSLELVEKEPKEQSIYDVMPDMYGKKEHEMYMFNLKVEKVNRECGEYLRSMDKIRETVRKFTGPVRNNGDTVI